MNKTFVTTDSLFARIEENLSQYSNNGVLDVGKFFQQVKLVTQRLGLDMFQRDEDILYLEDYKASLPCNFYNLDSAWLCHEGGSTRKFSNQQGTTFTWYKTLTEECVTQNNSCGTIGTCSEKVLAKFTQKEFIDAPLPISLNHCVFTRPLLLTIKDEKTKAICSKECANLFPTTPYEIHIRNGFLYSELSKPVIYIRYWAYPMDENTLLPLIINDEIIINAIEYHLMHYFFEILWLNGIEGVETRVKYLEAKKNEYFAEALSLVKLPSFISLLQTVHRFRSSWKTYYLPTNHF